MTQTVEQAQVVSQDKINPIQNVTQLALFNPDGTPYSGSGGGGAGDVTADGDNVFTGTNKFSGAVFSSESIMVANSLEPSDITAYAQLTDAGPSVPAAAGSTVYEGDGVEVGLVFPHPKILFPTEAGTFATQEWVTAQIAAAIAAQP